MATAYHRDQPGAPALVYQASQYVVAHFTALKTILKACLVSGYGSQPAAGWSLTAEGSDYIVLRNGSGSGYVCFSWVGGQTTVYLAETYTGMSGNVMTGDGLKSGVSAGNTNPQRSTSVSTVFGTGSTTWYMVADNKTFILALSSVIGTSPVELAGGAVNPNAPSMYYIGEDSAGHFISVGGLNTSSLAPTLTLSRFDGAGFTALKDPATGLLVDAGTLTGVEIPGLFANLNISFSTAITLPDVQLSPVVWFGSSVYGGQLRGLCLSPVLSMVRASKAYNCLGYIGTVTTRTANSSVDLGDGHSYFPPALIGGGVFFLLTDNPRFWL